LSRSLHFGIDFHHNDDIVVQPLKKGGIVKRFSISVTNPQSKNLEIVQKKTGLGLAEIFRRALDEYLERFKSEIEKEENRKQ
jgi:hypothetical protein